jgi:hypothetical protein
MADTSVAMDEQEISAFLGAGGTCVLSLARGDVPYSIPLSYGYDADERTFYLRLGFAEGSEKRAFLEASDHARLVVYDERGAKSVVATGELREIDDGELTPAIVERLSRGRLPLFEIWEQSKEEIDFAITRLRADRLTGRTVVEDADGEE